MDGLITNFSLISGVSGGHASVHTVSLTGFAGLVAGAFSMATGEYTSVRAQTEATQAEIAIEQAELARAPAAEEAELAGVFRRRGLDAELARQVARQLSRDPAVALRVHAQEELGVDIDKLASPWLAAGSSLVAFAGGAFLPLLPYLTRLHWLWLTAVLSTGGLIVVGAFTSRFTSRSAGYTATRQVALGGGAALITYLIGRAVGTSLA